MYDILLHVMEQKREDKIQGQLPTYVSQFVKFLTFQKQMFAKLIEI